MGEILGFLVGGFSGVNSRSRERKKGGPLRFFLFFCFFDVGGYGFLEKKEMEEVKTA